MASDLMMKKNSPVWKVIFIVLLIGNLVVGSWIFINLDLTSITALNVLPVLLILLIIDIIAILFYALRRHYSGKLKAMINAALIPVILMLLILCYFAIKFFI